MCYESWNQRKHETEKMEKAKQDADKLIEQARADSRMPEKPAPGEVRPVAETEKSTA